MSWSEQYTKGSQPTREEISSFIHNPCWDDLCTYIEETYQVMPLIEHSICSMASGWNVKYKKSGKALCTIYPNAGYFTCMVVIGSKEAAEAELLITACSPYVRRLYEDTDPFRGSRWMMIDVTCKEILEDVKTLIGLRVKKRN